MKIIDFFIPEDAQHDREVYKRAKVLVGIIQLNLCCCVIVALGVEFGLSLHSGNIWVARGILLEVNAFYILALFNYANTGSFTMTGNIIAVGLYIAILTGSLVTGGYEESPIYQLLMIVPVFTFLLVGMRSGLWWTCVTAATQVTFYVLHITGFKAWQLVTEANLELFKASIPVLLLLMVVGALIVYEVVNNQLKQTLQQESESFAYKASHDALTGLLNRDEFENQLEREILRAKGLGNIFGLVYLDLDGFKPINDRYGHFAGDEVLKITAKRLLHTVRTSDVVSRLGGDEYAIILEGIESAETLPAIARKILDAITTPITLENGSSVTVYGSLGIAVYPTDSTDGEHLCRYADLAMYRAKEQHNTYCIYQREDHDVAAA